MFWPETIKSTKCNLRYNWRVPSNQIFSQFLSTMDCLELDNSFKKAISECQQRVLRAALCEKRILRRLVSFLGNTLLNERRFDNKIEIFFSLWLIYR